MPTGTQLCARAQAAASGGPHHPAGQGRGSSLATRKVAVPVQRVQLAPALRHSFSSVLGPWTQGPGHCRASLCGIYWVSFWAFKLGILAALAGVAQWIECQPVNKGPPVWFPVRARAWLWARSPVGGAREAATH